MVLLYRKDCLFCKPLLDRGIPALVVEGPFFKVDGVYVPLPPAVTDLPALLDGKDIYIGLGPIEERLARP